MQASPITPLTAPLTLTLTLRATGRGCNPEPDPAGRERLGQGEAIRQGPRLQAAAAPGERRDGRAARRAGERQRAGGDLTLTLTLALTPDP